MIKTDTDVENAFERFRKAYPKRDGANPVQPARVKFETLVKRGVDPELIIAGARQLTLDEHKAGNIGTRFVPQAVTWLNQQRYADMTPERAPGGIAEDEKYWTIVITTYKKFAIWSRYAGPDPESPACRCPRELLIKHGIIRQAAE